MTAKDSDKHSLVFMGSGPVASASLVNLQANFEIEAIITKPATGQEMKSNGQGCPVHCVNSQSELNGLISRQNFSSYAAVIVDFGIIASQSVIDKFPLGIVNSHFSLLPQWRGADPIAFAILSGQDKTGVSLMLINEKLDEGPLCAQQQIAIADKATTPELTKKLVALSNQMLNQYLPLYLAGQIRPYPQDLTGEVSYSRKLTKQDGQIDWHKPAKQIEREIRAFIDWPKSHAELGKARIIIRRAEVVDQTLKPGEVKLSKREIIVGCGESSLSILELQPLSKSPMSTQQFLAGYKNQLLGG